MNYLGTLGYSLGTYQTDLLTKAAPASLAAPEAKIQDDLAQADAVLLTMNLAVVAHDQTGFNSGVSQILKIKTQLDLDAMKITG